MNEDIEQTSQYKRLRVWPPFVLLIVMIAARMLPFVFVGAGMGVRTFAAMAPPVCGLLIALWWLSISRARWLERIVGLIGIVAAFALTSQLVDVTMIGAPMIIVTLPMGLAAFAIGALLCRNVLSAKRTVVAVLFAAIGFGCSALMRGEGMWGDARIGLDWRFRKSPEQRLVAANAERTTANVMENVLARHFDDSNVDQWLANPEWPAFRGPNRNSTISGADYETDWSANPPTPLWRIPVGPGWSSFSVAGELLFTQEQRGDREAVVCYSAESGAELWIQSIESRFEESMGGPGPRATPTIAHSALFVMGANGQLMRLDAKTGDLEWETNLQEVANRKPPTWGFCSSPLVIDSLVIVHAGGQGELGTLAFDTESGQLVWSVAAGDHSYGSAQQCEVAGGSYVAILTNTGFDLIDPKSGEIKLAYDWKISGYQTLQPNVIDDNSILLPSSSGARLIQVSETDGALAAEEVWTSRLKSDFNDLVVANGYAYGFDGIIFSCIDLKTGERAWKRGRYGKGQVLLLKDAGLLLVMSESGNVVLLRADPSAHQELGEFKGLNDKTWNHPVIVGDRLFIRNSIEAACFRLPMVKTESTTAEVF